MSFIGGKRDIHDVSCCIPRCSGVARNTLGKYAEFRNVFWRARENVPVLGSAPDVEKLGTSPHGYQIGSPEIPRV